MERDQKRAANPSSIIRAISDVIKESPFPEYAALRRSSYLSICDTVLDWLRPPARILDFGAGPGEVSAVLAKLGFECTACDDLEDQWHLVDKNRERILASALRSGLDYRRLEPNAPFPFHRNEFDMVMMHDVLEHLHDSPRGLMMELLKFLRPGGLLFATVPNAANILKRGKLLLGRSNLPPFDSYYWYPSPWRGHVREYVRNDLVLLASYLDLEILELRGCHHHTHVIRPLLRSIWHMITALVPDGRDTWRLVARKRIPWRPKELPASELKRIIFPIGSASEGSE